MCVLAKLDAPLFNYDKKTELRTSFVRIRLKIEYSIIRIQGQTTSSCEVPSKSSGEAFSFRLDVPYLFMNLIYSILSGLVCQIMSGNLATIKKIRFYSSY